MTSKEWIKNELSYTDDHLTTNDRIMLNKVLEDLERLEELEKAQDLEIEKLGIIDGENVYQIAIRVLKVAFITLGKSDIANTCWFKYLEELEKENQELKKVIKKAIALLSVDGQGTKQEVKKLLSEVLG